MSEVSPDAIFEIFSETEDRFTTKEVPYWMPYKTVTEKLHYEQRIPIEIQPFIRAYAKRYKEESQELQKESLAEYLHNTREAWERHLHVNAAVDQFLSYELKNVFGDWSPKEWQTAKQLLFAAMDSDHKKAVYSVGIKQKLDTELAYLSEKYQHALDGDVRTQIATPGFVTFYEGRLHEHRKLRLSQLEGSPDETRKALLLEKYYGGDSALMERRMQTFNLPSDPKQLRKEITEAEANYHQRAATKRYLLLERQDLKDFEDLLAFDNVTEYEYTFSLKGLPDLFLREEILRRLVAGGYIPENISVFSLGIDEFMQAIDAMLLDLEKHFTIRLRTYHQTLDTCGTACVMSILNRKGTPLNQETELEIWQHVGKPYNFPGGLAHVLLRNGFPVTYVQENGELISKRNPEFASVGPKLQKAAEEYIALHKTAVRDGLHFQVADWDYTRVRDEIARGNACIFYAYVTETMSHCMLANGYKNARLEIIDPLGNIKYLSEEEFNAQIVTPMGKRLLIVQKLPYDFFATITKKLGDAGYPTTLS